MSVIPSPMGPVLHVSKSTVSSISPEAVGLSRVAVGRFLVNREP